MSSRPLSWSLSCHETYPRRLLEQGRLLHRCQHKSRRVNPRDFQRDNQVWVLFGALLRNQRDNPRVNLRDNHCAFLLANLVDNLRANPIRIRPLVLICHLQVCKLYKYDLSHEPTTNGMRNVKLSQTNTREP